MSTLADRLRGVLRTAAPNPRSLIPDPQDSAADILGGEWCDIGGQRFLVVDRSYRPGHRHGQMAIADAMPPADGLWPHVNLLANAVCAGRAVFVDLETTGLAGGAGTYAFLVGCAWFEPPSPEASTSAKATADGSAGQAGVFRIRQFVLTSFASERVLLEAVADVAGAAGTVVTFNGKTFDLPLMETRFVLHRRTTPFAGMPHLDMLHSARRLWRGDDEGCRLTALEQSLCGQVREGDVPGFEIPARYFHYVRSGDARPLEAVLEHNRLDLISLACLTARAALLLDEGPAAARGAREALGLGRLYERGGRLGEARACYLRACALDADAVQTAAEAWRAYALISRRLRCYEDAAAAWRQVLELPSLPAAIVREATEALAVHHEHRARDLPQARALTLQSLTCQGTVARQQALQHRLARLDRKLGDESPAVLF
jgi:uncharacterized protein YprB with RNaseH-like and TPR domain